MVKLSIIIPIYKVEKFLEECLDSVYKLKINKEIILVNDESPDNSNLIIEKYKKKYPNQTMVINQKNKGLSGARNSGLKIARGEYISFIDGDDLIDIKKFEEFFNNGYKLKLDIMIGTHIKYKDGCFLQKVSKNQKIKNMGIVSGPYFFEKSIKLRSFKEEVWDDIYRKDFLKENNLFFEERLLHEDCLFTIRALNKAQKVKYFEIDFYIYRQREGSIMTTRQYKNSQHKVYIVNKLLSLEKENEIKMSGLNSYLLSILFGIFIEVKEVNVSLLKKILSQNKKNNLKDLIKITIMFMASLKCKNIKIISNEELN